MITVAHPCIYEKSNFSLDAYVRHAKDFLNGRAERPRCMAKSVGPTDHIERLVTFSFDDKMLQNIVDRPKEFEKDFASALGYGYIGNTNGGRNGIVLLRNTDYRMERRVENYVARYATTLQRRHNIEPARAKGVKLVCHKPNGLRIVGAIDRETDNVLFFDQIKYANIRRK